MNEFIKILKTDIKFQMWKERKGRGPSYVKIFVPGETCISNVQ